MGRGGEYAQSERAYHFDGEFDSGVFGVKFPRENSAPREEDAMVCGQGALMNEFECCNS